MSRFVGFPPGAGPRPILRVIGIPQWTTIAAQAALTPWLEYIADASGAVGGATHYVDGDAGTIVARPAIPDAPASATVGAEWSVSGLSPGAAVTVSVAGAVLDPLAVPGDGVLRVTFGDPGAWSVDVGEAFPARPARWIVEVT